MKVMRTTVATVVAATLSMSAFSVFAEASLTGRCNLPCAGVCQMG